MQTNLFDELPSPTKNILPLDGEAFLYGSIFSIEKAKEIMHYLLTEIPWQHDEVILFDKKIITNRQISWMGDLPFQYTYAGTTKKAIPWTNEINTLKKEVERISEQTFNSCLFNLYPSGKDGMTWHSDNESSIVPNSAIASLTFGATRKFSFKHKKNKTKIDLILPPASLLVMKGETQKNWLHSVPKTTKVQQPRINLTFRQMSEHILHS